MTDDLVTKIFELTNELTASIGKLKGNGIALASVN